MSRAYPPTPGIRHIRVGVGLDVAACGARGTSSEVLFAQSSQKGTCDACIAVRTDPARLAERNKRHAKMLAGRKREALDPFKVPR